MLKTFSSAVLLSLTVATALGAQSQSQSQSERDLERAADRLSRTVEHAVDKAMQSVERALDSAGVSMQDLRMRGRQHGERADRIDTTFQFSKTGTIDLTSVSGDIVVTGWNRADVRVHAESNRSQLVWQASSSRLTISAEGTHGWNADSKYEVSAPEGVRLILRSRSGSITAKGTHGQVDANTTNGDIDVSDATDRVVLQTLAGDVTASHLTGDVTATSLNGTVQTNDVDGRSLRLESTSSDLVMQHVRAHDVTASTVSGDVEYRGGIESGGRYEFHSNSGTVTLTIPSDASAQVSVQTFSGDLDSAFPVTLQPDRGRKGSRRIEFTIGRGDAQIIADSFSGDIEIKRDAPTRRERGN